MKLLGFAAFLGSLFASAYLSGKQADRADRMEIRARYFEDKFNQLIAMSDHDTLTRFRDEVIAKDEEFFAIVENLEKEDK